MNKKDAIAVADEILSHYSAGVGKNVPVCCNCIFWGDKWEGFLIRECKKPVVFSSDGKICVSSMSTKACENYQNFQEGNDE